jgi:hypothetical protein
MRQTRSKMSAANDCTSADVEVQDVRKKPTKKVESRMLLNGGCCLCTRVVSNL